MTMERRKRVELRRNNSMKESFELRKPLVGDGSPSYGTAQDEYDEKTGSSSGSDSDTGKASTPPALSPLRFTCDLDHTQFACKGITLNFTGGCKPYSLSAFWFTDGKQTDPTWVALKEETWDDSFDWNIVAPVNSQLLFTITDAYGEVITSEDAIIVKSNNLGMARDSWCQYVYNNTPIPTAATNGSHRYSWNATSGQDDDDGDGAVENGTSSSDGVTSGGTATSTFASKVTATNSVDTNATDMNDKSTTISKAIHDANQAKTVEGVLAALLGLSLIALFALFLLFRRTRKRLHEARCQLASSRSLAGHPGSNGAEGAGALQGYKSEKAGYAAGHYSPTGAITPRAGRDGELRNPFDDPAAMIAGRSHREARSPFLNVMGTPNTDRGRMSVTSLVSAVPSNGARSTAADSSMSTEFYHTYKASTIPPRDLNHPNSMFGERMRNLFGAPLSFFSSATPSPSSSTSVIAGCGGGDTSSVNTDVNTDYYGDRNNVNQQLHQQRPSTTRSEGSAETIIIPITRVSTGSDFNSSAGSETQSNRLAPSSSGRSRRSSSSNAADESSVHSNDVYDDSDVASFSNFSYIDTGADEGESTYRQGGTSSSESEQDNTVIERSRNPFRDQSPDERMSKRRSWNGNYGDLDGQFLDSNDSLTSK